LHLLGRCAQSFERRSTAFLGFAVADLKRLPTVLCDSNEPVRDMIANWSSGDVDNAIEAICLILKRVGTLPKVLSNAYRHEIETGELVITRCFYEQLAAKCPDALDYFTEEMSDTREAKSDSRKISLREIPIE
jgi:hypothetical protein